MFRLVSYLDVYKRCGDCLEELSPGAKWRAVDSPLLLCNACAQPKQAKGNRLVRQYGWEKECTICQEVMPKVYLACKSGATAETGHTFCMDCLKGLGLEEQEGHLANYFFPCPMCRQEILHAVQSPAELCFLIDGAGEKNNRWEVTGVEGPEAHEDPSREAMNQYIDDGIETAKQHAALRATNSQVGQDNAPAAENDTSDAKEESISAQPPTNSPFDGVDDASSCMLATGERVWLSETDVQEVWSPAVYTYWNCKDKFESPKDLIPPTMLRVLDRYPEKSGHLQAQMVGCLVFSGTNPEKKQFFEHEWIQHSTCKLIFNYESVYLPETEPLTRWPIPYQKWRQRPSAPEYGIQFIHSHRNFQTDSTVFFHFSILSKDRTNATFE
ncbi:hypothetical protein MRS44_018214 [Fusarium solani]|uniref:uncharacterized protein n=1 Tax=Fusarium solani TaxID=169388 RepID=UPI0032C3EBA9|nr:hypothetical protein MRS44_018214 [Fusarium solani]